jgi:hypothetical protein
MTSLTHMRSARLTQSLDRSMQNPNRIFHLRDLVKACVFHRIKETRQGVDELQVTVAVASPLYDLQEEYTDVCALVDESIKDAMAFLPEVPHSEVAQKAIVEGAIAGIELTKREAILKAQAEIEKIQAYIADQEAELDQINSCVINYLYRSSTQALPGSNTELG